MKNSTKRETFLFRGLRKKALCTWLFCKNKAGWRKTDERTYRALCADHAIAYSLMPRNHEDVEPLEPDVIIEGEFNYNPHLQTPKS